MFLYNYTWGDTVSSGEAIRFKSESEKRIHFRIKNGRQQVSFHVYLYERQCLLPCCGYLYELYEASYSKRK